MNNASRLYPELEKFLINPATTKKEVEDLLWFLEHPECEHRIVGIREFIDSPEYLNAGQECWDSTKNDAEELCNGNFTEAVLCQAIGSGKSFFASVITTYQVYRLLCLKDPQGYYGLARGSTIVFLNMSIRADQSKKVVFGEIKARIDNSPWFQRYCPPDPEIRSELRFPKNIIILPGNSKETFPLGYNIFGGVMDEAAFYTDIESHDVAEDMFNALHSRIKNRFGDKGLLVMISSPRYVDDFIETKMKEAKTNQKIFARRKMFWESKPSYCFSGNWIDFEGYKIPAEFETEAKRNPEAFKRDYMALPSLALEPYFKQFNLVEAAIDPQQCNPLTEDGKIKIDFRGKPGKLYYMHIDLSLTTDATGIAMCHMESKVLIIDLMMRIKAPQGREIDLAEIKGIVYGLKKMGFDIAKVTYDSFQSASSIQELQKQGFNAERLSVDKDLSCYETLKEGFYTGKVKMYLYQPLMDELRRLELKDGKKVDHPQTQGGSKDCADAIAGAVYNCVTSQNNFQFWWGGDVQKHKTQEEITKEAEILTIDSLVTYGYWQNRRPY